MLKSQSSTILAFAHRPTKLHLLKSTMKFSDRLQQIMQQKGISPTALSERTGIALAHISQLRHGKRNPSRKTLERLSQALEISLDELLNEMPKALHQIKDYPQTEFDKEIALFREVAKKYGVDGVRTAREMLPVIFRKKPQNKNGK